MENMTYEEQREEILVGVVNIIDSGTDVYEELTAGNPILRAAVAVEVVDWLRREVIALNDAANGLRALWSDHPNDEYVRGRLDSTIILKIQLEKLCMELLGLKIKEKENELQDSSDNAE